MLNIIVVPSRVVNLTVSSEAMQSTRAQKNAALYEVHIQVLVATTMPPIRDMQTKQP